MLINLKYGEKLKRLHLDNKYILGILKPEIKEKPVENLVQSLIHSFNNPYSCLPLKQLIKKKSVKKVLIILDDITRPNPDYPQIIKTIIGELNKAGIKHLKFIIASGTHRKMTYMERKTLYGLDKNYEIIQHNCDDKTQLVSLGKLSTGNELVVNKVVIDCDFIITTGNIEPHAFAGYTGGRKAILPGISGRKTITKNHAMVVRENIGMGILENNPVHLEMLEAAKKVGVDFIINFIRNEKKEILKIVSGDLEKAFIEGVKFAQKIYTVTVSKPCDVAIVSCGGYPRDINLYQAQKSLSAVNDIVKDNGSIVLVAECSEGYGQKIFHKYMISYSKQNILHVPEENIEVEGHRAYLTKKIILKKDIFLLSSLPRKEVEKMEFIWINKIDNLTEYFIRKYKNHFKVYIIPDGSSIIPRLKL